MPVFEPVSALCTGSSSAVLASATERGSDEVYNLLHVFQFHGERHAAALQQLNALSRVGQIRALARSFGGGESGTSPISLQPAALDMTTVVLRY